MEKIMAFENQKELKQEISSKTVGENLLQDFPPPIIWNEQLNKAYQQAIILLQKLSDYYQNNVQNFNNLLLIKALIPDHKTKLQRKLIPIELKSNLESIDKISQFNQALELGLNLIENQNLNFSTLLKIYELIMQDSQHSNDINASKIREHQIYVTQVNRVLYTPPAPDELPQLIERFDQIIQRIDDKPLILIGICHHLFLNIHPFSDGNGRISMIMICLFLVKNQLLPKEIACIFNLYLYAYYHSTSKIYTDLISRTRHTNDLNQWLIYFLDNLSLCANELINKTYQVQGEIYTQVQQAQTPLQKIIVQQHLQFPYFSINQIAQVLQCPRSTTGKAIKDLESQGLLSYLFTYQKNKMYGNQEIIQRLSEKIYIKL